MRNIVVFLVCSLWFLLLFCHHCCHYDCFIHLVPANTKLVSSSPAAECPSQLSSEEMLEGESDLMYCIAMEIYEKKWMKELAIKLLEGGKGRGVDAYIERKVAEIKTQDPALLVNEVLKDWIREGPREATKTRLYEVLSIVYPRALLLFKPFLTSKLELHDQLTNQLYISREKRAQVQLL